jgi:hypothetical protein
MRSPTQSEVKPGDVRGYRFCGETIASTIDLRLLEPGDAFDPACTIERERSCDRAAISYEWFHHWRIGRQPPLLSFARADDGYVLRFRDLADFIVSRDGAHIRACPSRRLPEDTLRHLLLDQVLPLALSRRGRLLLHASAVHVPGIGALAFAGPTGRGKSTLAAALASCGGRILSDDCLALESRAGELQVLPAYPGLRLWPDNPSPALRHGTSGARVAHYTRKRRVNGGVLRFRHYPSRLRALFLLSDRGAAGPTASIRRCRAPARLMGLVKYAYLLDIEDREHLARTFDALTWIATSVPVLRLRVRHGYCWLAAAAEQICAYAESLPPTPHSTAAASARMPQPAFAAKRLRRGLAGARP